jgi:hypothetical protein
MTIRTELETVIGQPADDEAVVAIPADPALR